MEFLVLACLSLLSYATFCLLKSLLDRRNRSCFMLHYGCYNGKHETKLDNKTLMQVLSRNKDLDLEDYRFLVRTMVNSGLGEETYGPRNFVEREERPTLHDAHSEMDKILFDLLDNLFAKTGISPSEIDILIVNVSLFAPVPSLASRVISRYKMREDIKSYNLSGLGCAASSIAIDLAQRMFKMYKNATAIVLSTESIGPNIYYGKNRSMILPNCFFRVGGSSFLLTNNAKMKNRAIMKLKNVVRTHIGSDDEAYACCMQMEDAEGLRGVQQTKHLKNAGVRALNKNLKVLLPKVLPMKELFRYVIVRSLGKKTKGETPGGLGLNLKTGLKHFCIQPTTRANIEAIGKSLGLNEYDIEPSRVALHRFGNTSSCGVWYVFGYMEAKKRLKKGDKVLVMGLSAGVESVNSVWEIMKDIDEENVWSDSAEHYPEMLVSPNLFELNYGWINDQTLSLSQAVKAIETQNTIKMGKMLD
ncbi:PREDICTED: 3-ketoacyl-CoA synthase 19-like [Tarenaya hassleriana]|uniref:3-ketoacyl-CoA synthase 19-like n=1 Tax=Tarenaya hassleriana TaxID=28532 RepID=UPI00053C1B54|nr:PREDICTED: 3-ketoacyl-CoA synthase 19-like [Tarenaya hassleriana]